MTNESPPKQTLQNMLSIYLNNLIGIDQSDVPEMEIRFGTARQMKSISRLEYDNVIKRLLSNQFELSVPQHLLRINTEYTDIKTGATKLSNIRAELSGMGNISKYCKNNSIAEFEESKQVNFVQKNNFRKDDGTVLLPLDVQDFNFRAALSIEKNLNDSNMVKNMIRDWSNTKKIFRYINRFTLTHPDYPVNIDVSIVKQSIRKGKFVERTYNFIDAKIQESPEVFEIEIEIDNKRVGVETKFPTATELLIPVKKCITLILSGLQQTNFPISYPDQKEIIDQYINILWKNKTFDRVFPKNFVGPSSISLQINNIAPINENSSIANIRNNYTVTDKADGDRKLLFVSQNKGYIYLIDTNMNVQFTGAKTMDKNLYNSIIDGEHILLNKDNEFINLYAAFDIYYINKVDQRAKSFIGNEKDNNNYRLALLNKFINDLKPKGINSINSPIRIEPKVFIQTTSTQSIFEACNYISSTSKDYEYETDGLIFTPMNTGVGSNKEGQTTLPNKITWDLSFKWKPPKYNTIDFLVEIQKDINGKDAVKNIFQEGTNLTSAVQISQYKTVILRVGFEEGKNGHGYINPCLSIINDDLPSTDDKDNTNNYKPVQFFPTNPADDTAGICNLMLEPSSGDNYELFTENREIIEDNMIVEFRYNLNKEKEWRWEPLRVRYDKTADLRNGGKNYGNAFHVANSNWHSIHNPVTLDMLTTGLNIPDELGDDDIYYNRVSKNTITRSLRDFHNLFVKKKLIMGVSKPGNSLIDYAVGMAGDLPKWIESKLSFVFGIDISKDNIQNRMNGACARYLNNKKKFKIMPDALFVSGDSSKNIRNLDGIFTEKGKQITNAIFGNAPRNKTELGQGVYKNYGKGSNGFNVSSIQFAIHYMFETDTSLNNFLRNVSETTQKDGYFIGTCFDGEKIFNYLKNTEVNQSKEIFEDGKKLWSITKRYDRKQFLANESSVGYGVDIYMESINKVFREYLVNFKYFNRIMENYGFKILSEEEAKSIGFPSGQGSFKDLYEIMKNEIKTQSQFKNKYGSADSMSDNEMIVSFFNNYFIFKKISDIPNPEATVASLVNQSKTEELLEKEETEEVQEIINNENKEIKKIKKPKKLGKIKLKQKK